MLPSFLRIHEEVSVGRGRDWAVYYYEILLLHLFRRSVVDISEKSFLYGEDEGEVQGRKRQKRRWRQHFAIDFLILVPHGL